MLLDLCKFGRVRFLMCLQRSVLIDAYNLFCSESQCCKAVLYCMCGTQGNLFKTPDTPCVILASVFSETKE